MKRFTNTALIALLGTSALVAAPAAFAQDDEIVVRGSRIPDEKRATSEISSVLDEESFVRTGDSDIASALSRVSGLSVSDGKFVIVRGLNERYSSVTINGSPLPSPEPLRRVVPLDLIPTSFLGGSLVQKTYSPQFSAEFGGGLVELRTKSIPDEFYFNVGLSVGLDTATTGNNGLTHDGGELDFLGFDDGTRDFPAAFLTADGVGAFDQNTIDAALNVPETAITFETVIPPDYGVSTAFGGFFDFSDDIRVGANFALNFGNDFQTREGRRERGLILTAEGADGAPLSDDFGPLDGTGAELFNFRSTTQTATLNGLSSLGAEIGDNHELTFTTFVLRSTLKDTRTQNIANAEEFDLEIFQENFEFFERQVWQTQLNGEHVFPSLLDLSVEWRGAYGRAFRDAPFQRQVQRVRSSFEEDFLLPFGPSAPGGSIFNSSNSVTFSDVRDENIDAGIDFVLPLEIAQNAVDVRFGYAYTDKERDTITRDFIFDEGLFGFPDVLRGISNDVLFGAVAESDIFDATLITNPISLDNAVSTLQVQAGYVGVDVELGPYLRLAAGGRFESSEQVTTAFATNFPGSATTTIIDENFLLPSATLTWNPIGDLQVRVGYSQTITRPQFRELTPALFLDDDTDQLVIGNPFLVNSEINNIDARVEYYFSRGQFVTFGAFYKDITNPIEATSTELGGASTQTFVNAPSAELYGFEFEFERVFDLADAFDNGWFDTKELVFKTNYTYSQSDVSADGDIILATVSTVAGATPNIVDATGVIVDGRSLQGQSDHLFNLQLGLEDVETNSKATLLVNWASSRIRQTENLAGGNAGPAVIERAPVLVDFVWSRDLETFGGDWEINLKVRNILGDDYEATQSFPDGTVGIFDAYDLGREISVGLKKRF